MTKDKDLIYKYLNKILSSRHFVKSKISCDLLLYLVEASLSNKNLKEYTIGIELFGKKYDNESKQDSNIRVYIHTVRKKLKAYYETEGSKDQLIFVIEKGKYQVRFDPAKAHRKPKKNIFLIPFLVTLTTLVIVSVIFFNRTNNTSNKWANLPIWQDFADTDKNTLLVLGDYFVFNGILPTGNTGIYRDFSINSEVDYEYLLDKKPELVQSLSKSNLTYLSKMAVYCQSNIYKVFAQTGASIDVKLSSDIQPEDLKENNIIFVGNYKNMGIFENIVKEMSFSFGISSSSKQFIFSSDPCSELFEPKQNNSKATDYALLIYTEGFSNNRLLFFLSTQDIGNISTVNQFTDIEYFKQFTDEHNPQINFGNFKALYQVEGINKTDLSFDLIRVE